MNHINDNIAIVILNYKSWEDTIEEVNICKCVLNIDVDNIVVIDNCSPNDSKERLKEKSVTDGFTFIEAEDNKGYGAGNNIGLKYAFHKGYKYALILNNDIIINDSNMIFELLKTFKENDNIAVVNPDIYSPDGHLFNRDAIKPTFFDYTIGMLNYKRTGRKIKDFGGYGYVYRPQGCCMMVDLDKMNEIDYFDEKTFLYCEEPILAERFLKRKYLCACNTKVSVIHNHSKTVKSTFDVEKIIKINNASFSYYLEEYRRFNKLEIGICCFFNALKLRLLNG